MTAWIGWDLYGDLRKIILEGFDKQLTAPSVVTAAFIDPADHEWLSEKRHVRGLAYSSRLDEFYALADTGGRTELVRLSATLGTIAESGVVLSTEVQDLAIDHESGLLVGLLAESGSLVSIEPSSGDYSVISDSPLGIREICDGPVSGGIWLLGESLILWNPTTGGAIRSAEISTEAAASRMGGLDPASDRMVLINSHHDALFWQSLEDPTLRSLEWEGEVDLPLEVGYDKKRERWVVAQERLRLVNMMSGQEVADSFQEAYGRENTPQYREIVEPMIRLHRRLGLSFLYSQIVEAPDRIIYVVDAPESGTYSPLLSEDELPASEVEGITRLKALGTLHYTDLQRWEQWGWLKSAFAPILDDEGRAVAMVGTDFNASVIEHRTRQALLAVFAIGGIALVAASAWSLLVSVWLRRPIEELKSGALAVAAGDFRSLKVDGSREVNDLASVFNHASSVMETLVDNLTTEVEHLLRRRDRVEVTRVLNQRYSPSAVLRNVPGVIVNQNLITGWGAMVMEMDVRLIWWECPTETDDALKLKNLCIMSGQVSARFGTLEHSTDRPSRWPENVGCVLRVDPAARTLVIWMRQGTENPLQLNEAGRTSFGYDESKFDVTFTGYDLQEGSV
ncbi:HAMP domain-containing protein [Opitutaceae bacterium]|nr:HAMP domain-containing protein [Opitutaceae bacterium]